MGHTFIPDRYKRVEKRKKEKNHVNKEAIRMKRRAAETISFGTFTWTVPKPTDHITHFTLAISKPVRKDLLYQAIAEALGNHWNGAPTKSISLHISRSIPWHKTRKQLVAALKPLLLKPEGEHQ